jgi:imidazole glycerol phosphate synthase subunit HisF
MAAASALAKQALVMGVDPSRLVARPKGPRPAPAGQQHLSACSAKAGEESTVSENIAIARNAEAKGYVGVIVNDFEEKARREKEEAEAAWRQSGP